MLGFVTAVKLREWRGVKPVGDPAGAAITARLWTTPEDEQVLDLVADHLGTLRRADLAAASRPQLPTPTLDDEARRQARRDRLNTRKKALTAQSSARWANAIIASNDAQYRLARDAQHRHIIGLKAAITTIEKRLAQPTADTLTPEQRKERKKARRRRDTRPRARGSRNNAGYSGCVPNWPACPPTLMTGSCMSSRAVNGWPRPDIISSRRI
jgi:hypothetical protein